jgi:hypothetical protein
MVSRNLLLSATMFLTFSVAAFSSVHFGSLVFAKRQRELIEAEYDRVLEQEILQRDIEWAKMEMARYEKANGFLPVRPEQPEDDNDNNTLQPVEEASESNGMRGYIANASDNEKKSIQPF